MQRMRNMFITPMNKPEQLAMYMLQRHPNPYDNGPIMHATKHRHQCLFNQTKDRSNGFIR